MADHILQFFVYTHLSEELQEVSRPFQELAQLIVHELPQNPERTVALRKLLESKDAAVRAKLAKPVVPGPPPKLPPTPPARPDFGG